ncbi:MAG: hypothetical protein D9V47_03060 [Clostridia bacterium]|nr:MAG: hypothetical protein D9V47_03060 [Clostridia bacterium]
MRKSLVAAVLIGVLAMVALAAVALDGSQVAAKPTFGSNCASCHGVPNPTAAPGKEPAAAPTKEPAAPAKEQAPAASKESAPAKASQPAAKPAASAPANKEISVTCGNKTAKLASVTVNGNTLIEGRALASLIGGSTSWDNKAKEVTIALGNSKVTMSAKTKAASVNGQEAKVTVGVTLVGGKVFVPVRFVAESLGLWVDYDRAKGITMGAGKGAPAAGSGSAAAPATPAAGGKTLGLNKDLALPGYVGSTTCKGCHPDAYDSWQQTRHSKMLQDPDSPGAIVLGDFSTNKYFKWEDVRYIVGNGLEGGQRYVGEIDGKLMYLPATWDNEKRQWVKADPREYTCAGCHTAGFNKETGNWAENGITCESCHGPGAEHVKNPMQVKPKVSTSVDMCSSCHGDDRQTGAMKKMWVPEGEENTGGHLGLFAHEIDAVNAPGYHYSDRCLGCHSATYIVAQKKGETPPTYDDFMKGALKEDRNGITCVVCHDPHSNTGKEFQLREDPLTTCMQCHDAPDHHPSGTVMVKGGPIYKPDGSKAYVGAAKQADCVSCHMLEGNHTFKPGVVPITSHGATTTYNACGNCHTEFGPASDINEETGKVDPALTEAVKQGEAAWRAIQAKNEEEFEPLKARQEAVQKKFDDLKKADPNSTKVKGAEPYVTAAFKNVEIFENDGSKGIHNMKYVEAAFAQLEADLAKAEELLK